MLLHIDLVQVRHTVDEINRMADTITQELAGLRQSLNNLAANWNGPASNLFVGDMQGVINMLAASRDEAQECAIRVRRFVDEWETVDWQGVQEGEGLTPLLYQPEQMLTQQTLLRSDTGTKFYSSQNPKDLPTMVKSGDATMPAYVDGEGADKPEGETAVNFARVGVAVPAVASTSSGPTPRKNRPSGEVSPKTGVANSDSEALVSDPRPISQESWGSRLAQLSNLQTDIARLEAIPNKGPLGEHNLRELRDQQQELQTVVDAGISAEGRSPGDNPFPEGECTWFATSKRDLYPSVYGHAKLWAEQAAANGVEVGNIPIKGSIMVWQPGVFKAHAEFGHVSFVEGVERLADGTFKVFYTDNLSPDTIRNVIIAPGTEGVDFIY